MSTKPSSTCGTRSSAETTPNIHVLNHASNTIKGALLKRCIMNGKWLASMNGWELTKEENG
jgi:hypothetical protein